MPTKGRYVQQPARLDANGVASVPPAPSDPLRTKLAILGAALGALAAAAYFVKKQKTHQQNAYPTTEPDGPRHERTGEVVRHQ